MQLTVLLALEAMHQSYAANCLLPHPRAPCHESELGSCVDECSVTEGVRDLKVTEAQQQKVHDKAPRRTTSPEPVEAAAAKPSTSGQAQQQHQALHSGAQKWNSCHFAAPRHVCTMSKLYMTEGYGCWWCLLSTAASSLGSDLHCKAQGGCRGWDVLMLQGSPVPLMGPMHRHHSAPYWPAAPEAPLRRAAALSVVSAFIAPTERQECSISGAKRCLSVDDEAEETAEEREAREAELQKIYEELAKEDGRQAQQGSCWSH